MQVVDGAPHRVMSDAIGYNGSKRDLTCPGTG